MVLSVRQVGKGVNMRRILFIAVFAIFLIFPDTGSVSETSSRISIAAVGDVMAHAAILRCARRHSKGAANNSGYDYLFERVAPIIRAADIACCNAEFPVAKRLRQVRRSCVFNSPRGMVDAIRNAGFDVANVANNHSYDQGKTAVGETVDAFKKAGVEPIGAGKSKSEALSIKLFERNGLRVAFIGASCLLPKKITDFPRKGPQARYFRIEEMTRSIREARRTADVVVVSVHWGVEYDSRPRLKEIVLAKKMMEAGADVIAGHHPHVLQPVIEHIASDGRRCIAAMSLGNFISNQSPSYRYGKSRLGLGNKRDGAILRVEFEKDRDRVRLVTWDAVPLWTWTDRVETGAGPFSTYNMQVWSIPEALVRVKQEIGSRTISNEKRIYLRRMHDDLFRRGQATLAHMGAPQKTSPVLSSLRALP